MKHNGSRIFNGTAGPPPQTSLHHLNNHHPNPFLTKSIHHLNGFNYSTGNPPNSSFVHLNKSHHPFSNYHYLTPGSNYPHYYHPYPLDSKGLYRINSALNLDHIEFETNLKREFGSVSSIGALGNNYPYPTNAGYSTGPTHHHANAVAPLHSNQEHLLSFYSILKEFKRQNLENHQPPGGKSGFVTSSSNKIHDYLRARSEMSNADLVTNGNPNLAKGSNYDKLAHHLHEASPHKKLFPSFSADAAYNGKLITSNPHPYLVTTSNHHASPSPYHPANELSASASLSAYHSSNCKLTNLTNNHNNHHNNHHSNHHSNAASLIGSNLALDDCVQPSPRVKKKLSYKIWEISKSEKNLKSKCKMSGESSTGGKPDAGSSTVDGSSTRAIFKKFTRIGSSKNVSSGSNSNASSGEQAAIQEEYRSLNQAVSTTHLDDPEVRFEEKLRKKGRFLCKLLLL